MPKKGNGKTRMQNLVMEFTAICMKLSNSLTEQVVLADNAIEADLADDPFMVETLKLIKSARAEENADARDAFLARAEIAITEAIRLDFADDSLATLKRAIIPHISTSDRLKVEALQLQTELFGVKPEESQ